MAGLTGVSILTKAKEKYAKSQTKGEIKRLNKESTLNGSSGIKFRL